MKRVISIIVIMLLVLSMGMINVYAAHSCKVDMKCSSTSVKKGDTVELIVSVSDIDAGEGIAGFQAVLDYNSDIFSKVELEKADNWEKPTLLGKSITMTTETGEATKENQELFKIKLTAKEDATEGSYEVSLTGIKLSTDDLVGIVMNKALTVTLNVKAVQSNTDTDKDADKDADKDSDKDADKDADKDKDKDTDKDADKDTDKDADKDKDKDKDADKDADKDSDKDADKDTDKDANKDADKNNSNNTTATNTTNTTKNNTTSNQQNSNSAGITNKPSLPKTGVSVGAVIVVVAVICIAAVSYSKYKKYRDVK